MSTAGAPRVSVIMANLNGAAHIAAAVRSVLRQSERSLELIVSDDGSSDDSLERAAGAAAGDPRLVLLRHGARSGPAAARNRALKAARGEWIAVVDNDDAIHPERIARLIRAAAADQADIVADDLLTFYEDGNRPPHAHLNGALARAPHWIGAAEYARSNVLFAAGPSLGYLKPVFKRVGPHGIAPAYDESLTIGEDSDLILRLLIAGWRMRTYPELGYFYRKHAKSISHRLNLPAIDAMEAAAARHDPNGNAALARALERQEDALADARAFTLIVEALKARDLTAAFKAAAGRPSALLLMRYPIGARLTPARPAKPAANPKPRVALISRQRIVGNANGSSAYVLAIARALKGAGYAVDFLGASPKLFGRWPAMRLKPETSVFASYKVHGGLKLGPIVLARDPRVALNAALGVLERSLRKFGAPALGWDKPAAYAQGAEATRADMLFLARHAPHTPAAVLADYCFATPLAPYALAPETPTLTIMHDLMSARVNDAKAESIPAEVAALTPEKEFALLGQSDAVLAIQAEEAAAVRAALPRTDVILAQHALACAGAPQPGEDDTLLFVGSNTHPNIVGLKRFFDEAWPLIRQARPNARLLAAGSVARGLEAAPEGVSLLGVVDDLAPLYRDAGIVISPLHTGSGLKIKLIEALAAGKAVVGTSVTVQGVADITEGALVVEDDSARFAEAAAALLGDRAQRAALAAKALACAEAHFSEQACFASMLDYLRRRA